MHMRVNNRDIAQLVTDLQDFTNNNGTVYAEHRYLFEWDTSVKDHSMTTKLNNRYTDKAIYVVYSYGAHFPMYIYDYAAQMWFGNEDRASSTTDRHQQQARPIIEPHHIKWLDKMTMQQVVLLGGYARAMARRLKGAA